MFNSVDAFCAPPFWKNGPAPGAFYNFSATSSYVKHSRAPVTTSTSVVAFTFNSGVIIAGDLLASYGSLARYRDCPRIFKVNDKIILGAGGDYADFQYVKDLIEQKIIDEECLDDGFNLKPRSLYCWLTRIMYNRRSRFDPFWNNFIVGGIQEGIPFLGTVDKLGTAYEDNAICSGYGAHLALPLIRDALEQNSLMSEVEAKALMTKCMEVLYYRDARSFFKYEIGVITDEGVKIEGPIEVEQKWDVAHMIH
ncbi:hypothetical protein FQA39_LY10682 [Lamprigera yunnana]|nr:hypothetical protein FQA39_LY10682 [Lamprigera yunnana]